MTSFTADSDSSGISPALQRAISATNLQVELDLPIVSGEDLADLKAILKGEKQTTLPIDLKRALNTLVRSERSPETREITARTLANSQQPSRIRSQAALNLSLLPAPETEQLLIRTLETPDTRLQATVAQSLGRIGSDRAFEQLTALENAPSPAVRRQVAFARQAIAYRSSAATPSLQTTRTRSAAKR